MMTVQSPTTEMTEIKTDAGMGRPPKRSRLAKAVAQVPISLRKNYGLATNPEFWQLLPLLMQCRMTKEGRGDPATRLFVATHHKSMTTYFNIVLRLLAFGLDSGFQVLSKEVPKPGTRVFMSIHSRTPWSEIGPYRGVHVMRDPRDMIVSSYHYHLWTNESWAHVPDENGQTYQEKLNAADKTEGLFMAIRHFIFFNREILENWDMDDPDMLEVPYDALMGPEREQVYDRIFRFMGLEGKHHELGIRLMRAFEAGRRSRVAKDRPNERAHIRSGKSGQWKAELEPAHIAFIEQELGHILDKFGFERSPAPGGG